MEQVYRKQKESNANEQHLQAVHGRVKKQYDGPKKANNQGVAPITSEKRTV
tara:strand:+ start:126 stop:278 length:153 start_codon:yes stop_codon:yes gene_type:complete